MDKQPLSSYELALIHYIKGNINYTFAGLLDIFMNDRNMDKDSALRHIAFLAGHLFDICVKSGSLQEPNDCFSLFNDIQLHEQWKFGVQDAPEGIWGSLIRVLSSKILNTPVRDWPNYQDKVGVVGV